jgi:hypothetical protein
MTLWIKAESAKFNGTMHNAKRVWLHESGYIIVIVIIIIIIIIIIAII